MVWWVDLCFVADVRRMCMRVGIGQSFQMSEGEFEDAVRGGCISTREVTIFDGFRWVWWVVRRWQKIVALVFLASLNLNLGGKIQSRGRSGATYASYEMIYMLFFKD